MATYKTLKLKLTGTAPLLCHNGQLADPFYEWTKKIKQISSKSKKTDADQEEMARLEWYGGMYWKDGKPAIPGHVIKAALSTGARKLKLGPKIKAGVNITGLFEIQNGSPMPTPEEMWANHREKFVDRRRVVVNMGGSSIMRTRPIFHDWHLDDVEVQYDPDVLNEEHIFQAFEQAGVAIGDYTPDFGRFKVEKV